MTDRPSHSTLREWRAHMTTPVALSALGGIVIILTIMAPYETGDLLRVVPRFGYWLAVVFSTYSAGYLVNTYLTRHFKGPRILWIAGSAVLTAIAVALLVALINGTALGYWPSGAEWPVFLGNVFLIALVIAIVIQVVSDQQATSKPAPIPPALLDRLPFEKRGALMAISVEDHYVRIRTSKGEEMVLMRLTDAMREVQPEDGLQVHRSHWVARDAIAAARREGDRAILTLTDGYEVPVSRRYVGAIKDAGFLAR